MIEQIPKKLLFLKFYIPLNFAMPYLGAVIREKCRKNRVFPLLQFNNNICHQSDFLPNSICLQFGINPADRRGLPGLRSRSSLFRVLFSTPL